MDLVSLFLVSLFQENSLFTKFLGLCPFTTSKKQKPFVTGLLLLLVMLPVTALSYGLYHSILKPYGLTTWFFLVVISLIFFVLMLLKLVLSIMEKKEERYQSYLPFILMNSAVSGIILSIVPTKPFLETMVSVCGSGIGLLFALYLLFAVQKRMNRNPVPSFLKGIPIVLLTASIVSLLFERFVGL